MEIKKLTIEKPYIGENKGKYIAEVCVGGKGANMCLALPPDISHKILVMCIDELCAATDTAAQELKKNLLATIPPLLAQGANLKTFQERPPGRYEVES